MPNTESFAHSQSLGLDLHMPSWRTTGLHLEWTVITVGPLLLPLSRVKGAESLVARCSKSLRQSSTCCYQSWQASLGTWVPQRGERSRCAVGLQHGYQECSSQAPSCSDPWVGHTRDTGPRPGAHFRIFYLETWGWPLSTKQLVHFWFASFPCRNGFTPVCLPILSVTPFRETEEDLPVGPSLTASSLGRGCWALLPPTWLRESSPPSSLWTLCLVPSSAAHSPVASHYPCPFPVPQGCQSRGNRVAAGVPSCELGSHRRTTHSPVVCPPPENTSEIPKTARHICRAQLQAQGRAAADHRVLDADWCAPESCLALSAVQHH